MRMAAMLGDYKAMQLSDGIPQKEQTADFWARVERRAALGFQRAEYLPPNSSTAEFERPPAISQTGCL